MLFVLLCLAAVVKACHPECHVVCDNPVVFATCQHVCLPPTCAGFCQGAGPYECSPARCNIECPEDQCEADACPACEVFCDKPSCYPWGRNCSMLCEEPQCSWRCEKPSFPPNVTCEWECEAPACEAAAAAPEPGLPEGNALILVLSLSIGPCLALIIVAFIVNKQK